jgi:hypothetical protein
MQDEPCAPGTHFSRVATVGLLIANREKARDLFGDGLAGSHDGAGLAVVNRSARQGNALFAFQVVAAVRG